MKNSGLCAGLLPGYSGGTAGVLHPISFYPQAAPICSIDFKFSLAIKRGLCQPFGEINSQGLEQTTTVVTSKQGRKEKGKGRIYGGKGM